MHHIFIGFLLVFLDFNLNLGNSTIGLIPDFMGYYYMAKGLAELRQESPAFVSIRPFAVGMGFYSSVTYALDLFGITGITGWLGVIIGIVGTVLSLYISYTVISGVRDMEAARCADLNGAKLKSTWSLMAVFQGIAYISLVIPAVALVCIIGGFVTSIVFLVAFYKSRDLYLALPTRQPGEREN